MEWNDSVPLFFPETSVLKSLAYVKVMVGSNSQRLLEMERKVDVILSDKVANDAEISFKLVPAKSLEEFQNLEKELQQEKNAKLFVRINIIWNKTA